MDKEQLQLLKSGDKKLFSSIVQDHHRAMIAVATPIVGVSEAEEVVQNAWVKAYRNIAGFKGEAGIRTWLSRIVINEAKMQLRTRKKELLFAEFASDDSSEPLEDRFQSDGHWQKPPANWHYDAPDRLLMSADLQDCLDKLLACLPASQRAVLEMRDTSELPFEEICNTLSISESNARVALHRARTRLFRLVDHYQETGEC